MCRDFRLAWRPGHRRRLCIGLNQVESAMESSAPRTAGSIDGRDVCGWRRWWAGRWSRIAQQIPIGEAREFEAGGKTSTSTSTR